MQQKWRGRQGGGFRVGAAEFTGKGRRLVIEPPGSFVPFSSRQTDHSRQIKDQSSPILLKNYDCFPPFSSLPTSPLSNLMENKNMKMNDLVLPGSRSSRVC